MKLCEEGTAGNEIHQLLQAIEEDKMQIQSTLCGNGFYCSTEHLR